MRVSTSLIFNSGTIGIQNRQYDLYRIQNQLSSGKKILSPQDDPIGASDVLKYSQSKGVNEQYLNNQADATTKLSLLESTLGGVGNELQNIFEKAIQAGSGSYDSTQLGAIAEELKKRMQNLMGLANTQDGTGLYIFGGFKATTQPFQLNAAATSPYALGPATYVSYAGDSGNETLQVSASQTIATSESGADVFMRVKDGQGNLTGRSVFDGLQNLINIIDPTSGVPYTQAAYNQALGDISASINHISTERASVGARLQSLDSMTAIGEDVNYQYEVRLSELQDLDYASAITQFSRYQLQLEAAQQSFKQSSQLSLFNIL